MARKYSHSPPSPEELKSIFNLMWILDEATGCHNWIGPVFKKRGGYGSFNCRPAGIYMRRAHRVAWELDVAPITKAEHVLHRCDNPLCVNLDHLFIGDQAINMQDKVRKGRQDRGETHAGHKLTEAEATEILKSSEPRPTLADRFGVSLPTIYDIKDGRSWQHLHLATAP